MKIRLDVKDPERDQGHLASEPVSGVVTLQLHSLATISMISVCLEGDQFRHTVTRLAETNIRNNCHNLGRPELTTFQGQ